jgi:mannose-6-phosphate isomerase-like protein (cupin superfamily)
MSPAPINLFAKLDLITDQWSPRIVAQMNDYHFKLAKIEGEFVWHSHADTDEVFMVLSGRMEIALPDETVALQSGDLFVVPKGVQHKPSARSECHILMVEPFGTINTGDAGGERTLTQDVWI